MGLGDFKEPPPGPKIGPTKDISELTPEQREEYGDIERLKAAIVAEGQPSSSADPAKERARAEEGADRLEALQRVLSYADAAKEVDPIEESAEPTLADRQEFMRCVLGDQSYSKEYELFGGMIKVVMRDLSPEQEDVLFAVLAKQQKDGESLTEDDWELMLTRLRMVAGIARMIWSGKEVFKAVEIDEEALYRALQNLMKSLKMTTAYRALLRVVRIFRRHLDILVERASDSDFWIADGSDSLSEPISEAL